MSVGIRCFETKTCAVFGVAVEWGWGGVRGDWGARPATARLRGAAHAGKNEARAARLERPHLGKESHLVDGLDHGVEHLALEWPKDHRVVPATGDDVVRCGGRSVGTEEPGRRRRRSGLNHAAHFMLNVTRPAPA